MTTNRYCLHLTSHVSALDKCTVVICCSLTVLSLRDRAIGSTAAAVAGTGILSTWTTGYIVNPQTEFSTLDWMHVVANMGNIPAEVYYPVSCWRSPPRLKYFDRASSR